MANTFLKKKQNVITAALKKKKYRSKKINEMKRIVINAYQIGLVFKNGVYQGMLAKGKYWLWLNEQVNIYDINQAFVVPIELNILLEDARLAALLQVVEVADNEIAIQFENGLLAKVLTAGRYTYWRNATEYKFIKANIGEIEIDSNISKAILQNAKVAAYVRNYRVESYEKAVLIVDGKFVKVLEAGTYDWWKNNINISVAKADMRVQQLEINGQEILTKDKASLRINGYAQYQVVSIEQAVLENKEYERQLYVNIQLALRSYIAGYNFDELMQSKDAVADFVLAAVKESAQSLGIVVQNFGIRDIILPGDVKEIMNKVLIAEKNAQANSIMRREETASTRSLLNTAKLMEDNSMLWKLKEMEFVEKVAEKIGEITINGNGNIAEQLKQIFVTAR